MMNAEFAFCAVPIPVPRAAWFTPQRVFTVCGDGLFRFVDAEAADLCAVDAMPIEAALERGDIENLGVAAELLSGRILALRIESGSKSVGVVGVCRPAASKFSELDIERLSASADYIRAALSPLAKSSPRVLNVPELWPEREQRASVLRGRLVSLSERELLVARSLVDGYTAVNIAARTGLSEHTVRTYMRRLYAKLEVHNRADFVREMMGRAEALNVRSHFLEHDPTASRDAPLRSTSSTELVEDAVPCSQPSGV